MGSICEKLKVNMFIYDYSGYSCSFPNKEEKNPHDVIKKYNNNFKQELTPSEALAQDDVESAFAYLTETLENCDKININRVIIMGRSLGTGPACHLAAKLAKEEIKPAGLILQSPFLSAIRVVLNTPVTLPIDIFPNLHNITKVKFPIMIMHGEEDKVINVDHGRQLEVIAKKNRKDSSYVLGKFIKGAGHNDLETTFKTSYINFLQEFIKLVDTFDCNSESVNNDNSNKSKNFASFSNDN